MVQHHPSELQRLDVVLVQHEGFLKALHGRLEIAQLSARGRKPRDGNNVEAGVSLAEDGRVRRAVPVGLAEALVGVYEVWL